MGLLSTNIMKIQQTKNGDKHLSTLISMTLAASTYRNQGRWKEAEELEVQVMETCKRVLGPEHPECLNDMGNLAYTWKSLGKVEDALILMKKCYKLRSNRLSPNHPVPYLPPGP